MKADEQESKHANPAVVYDGQAYCFRNIYQQSYTLGADNSQQTRIQTQRELPAVPAYHDIRNTPQRIPGAYLPLSTRQQTRIQTQRELPAVPT